MLLRGVFMFVCNTPAPWDVITLLAKKRIIVLDKRLARLFPTFLRKTLKFTNSVNLRWFWSLYSLKERYLQTAWEAGSSLVADTATNNSSSTTMTSASFRFRFTLQRNGLSVSPLCSYKYNGNVLNRSWATTKIYIREGVDVVARNAWTNAH